MQPVTRSRPWERAIIAELRREAWDRGVLQASVAHGAGMSQAKLSRLFNHRQTLCMDDFVLICHALGLCPTEVAQAAGERVADCAPPQHPPRGRKGGYRGS